MSLRARVASWLVKSAGDPLAILRELYTRQTSWSGKTINTTTAIRVATVFACMRVIGEGIAQVPCKLFQEAPDGKSRLPAKNHPLYDLLHRRPNQWQTSFEFRETLAWHAGLAGNFFAFKNVVLGRIAELIPFEPKDVTVKRANDYSLSYEVAAQNGSSRIFPAESIWHVKGPSWNSWMGLQEVDIAREAIGLAMAAEETQARLHQNGMRSNVAISVDGKLDAPQYKELRDWLEKDYIGTENAWRPLILDRAAKVTPVSISSEDGQQYETRRQQIEEICRFFRVMPIMVGHSDKVATYASAEQMFLAHVVHTLAPWYERIEQSADVNLLSDKDRANGIYVKFVEEGLLRGSLKDTQAYLLGLVNGGLMTPNEGRAKLDLNPDDDPESDELRIPVNVAQVAEPAPDPVPATGE